MSAPATTGDMLAMLRRYQEHYPGPTWLKFGAAVRAQALEVLADGAARGLWTWSEDVTDLGPAYRVVLTEVVP